MASIRERILQAIAAKLSAVAAAQGAKFRRQPVLPLDPSQAPALLLYFDGGQVVDRSASRVNRTMDIRVAALARNADDTADLTGSDALLVAAHAALFADFTLSGLALAIEEDGDDLQTSDTADVAVMLSTRYRVRYRSQTAAIDAA